MPPGPSIPIPQRLPDAVHLRLPVCVPPEAHRPSLRDAPGGGIQPQGHKAQGLCRHLPPKPLDQQESIVYFSDTAGIIGVVHIGKNQNALPGLEGRYGLPEGMTQLHRAPVDRNSRHGAHKRADIAGRPPGQHRRQRLRHPEAPGEGVLPVLLPARLPLQEHMERPGPHIEGKPAQRRQRSQQVVVAAHIHRGPLRLCHARGPASYTQPDEEPAEIKELTPHGVPPLERPSASGSDSCISPE